MFEKSEKVHKYRNVRKIKRKVAIKRAKLEESVRKIETMFVKQGEIKGISIKLRNFPKINEKISKQDILLKH